jgi:penicillin-binding protein 1C
MTAREKNGDSIPFSKYRDSILFSIFRSEKWYTVPVFLPVFLAATLLLGGVIGFRVMDGLFPPDLSRLSDLSREVLDREGRLLRAYLTSDGLFRLPATAEDVDPRYLDALIGYEDKRFWRHGGVDVLAVLRAAWQAATSGRVVSGASTLTMQTARLLEPRPRTLRSKLVEMFRAVQLERRFSKRQILAMYLTLAPFGGNLEGVRAASLRYFARPPKELTLGEAALLVALPQAPTRLRPDRNPPVARAARDKVIDRLTAAGRLPVAEARSAKAGAVSVISRPLPFLAPHLADRLTSRHADRRVLRTTVEKDLQRQLESLIRQEARRLGPQIGAAVLVVENESRQVLAYLGSADFEDASREGQVDVIQALRSPGSTLKPALYAMAFDRGLAHPATLVDDVPTQFGDYAPANFMSRHYGRITLAEALRLSLNVPAVAVLDRLGPVAFAERLRRDGLRLRFGAADARPGLALALGGVGTTLQDLVRLYAAMASDGRLRALEYVEGGGAGTSASPQAATSRDPFVGAAARWYLGEILRRGRPAAPLMADVFRKSRHPIAFKTGTSYGFRDAWAIGYNATHTVGVWVGRPDGTSNPGHYGANTAAPILFRVFDYLPTTPFTPSPRPRGASPLESAALPPGLRFLGRDNAPAAMAAVGQPPRIVFPPDRTVVSLPAEGRPLSLEAEGGRRPLTWIVNGKVLPKRRGRWRADWIPDGVGFTEILLVDAIGRRARAEVRLIEDVAAGAR